jgi:hypothetical protein
MPTNGITVAFFVVTYLWILATIVKAKKNVAQSAVTLTGNAGSSAGILNNYFLLYKYFAVNSSSPEMRLAIGSFLTCTVLTAFLVYTVFRTFFPSWFVDLGRELSLIIQVLFFPFLVFCNPVFMFVTSPKLRTLFLKMYSC